MGAKTPRGNPVKGSQCDPKGKTVGVGTKRGRAAVAFGKGQATRSVAKRG